MDRSCAQIPERMERHIGQKSAKQLQRKMRIEKTHTKW